MRIAAIQPSFIPWRGYFDIIASVDIFVFLDDVQYTTRDWRNRNKIKTPKGVEWLSVPVSHKERSQLINETLVQNSGTWQKKAIRTWSSNYRATPYFDETTDILSHLNNSQEETISNLDIRLIKKICSHLNITTPTILSSELEAQGKKTGRLIDILQKLNATTYLSGPSADAYLDKSAFKDSNIQLEYKSYEYTPYPQLWGNFNGEVTVLDLISNCGPNSKKLITSRTPNRVVVPI